MRAFARLYRAIDETNKTNEKVTAIASYLRQAPPGDAMLAIAFLTGRRPKRLVTRPRMIEWAVEISDLPMWLFDECYDVVGDLAETIANVLPAPDRAEAEERSLTWWVEERLLALGGLPEAEQKAMLIDCWRTLPADERFVWNKLITGSFRVGVSQQLVVRAISEVTQIPVATISHRLMGDWEPTAEFYRTLGQEADDDAALSRPYPFCLAYPLESDLESLGSRAEWFAEWKWDGIRAQLIRRAGQSYIWSRGEDLVTDRFPEIESITASLPDGTTIDGEILAWADGQPLPFQELQKRIGRKILSKKVLADVPVSLVAFDLLEWNGVDLRERPFVERRRLLSDLVQNTAHPHLHLSREVSADSWEDLAAERLQAREHNVEGLMLKRLDSPYLVGRKKGAWWKWKIEPLSVDAVLIYAQRGSGKRASLYTDYTFGIWRDGQLVPFAKAYSGLTDAEIRDVDRFVRNNTLERFGPVRTVKAELVMELAFEGIQASKRHKSGVAVRFPRIARLRPDKTPEQADSLETILSLLGERAK